MSVGTQGIGEANRLRGCFVTGTDTDVGKTRVSAALLHWLALQGWRSAGYKPVAAGMERVDGAWRNPDVFALRHASAVRLSDAEVGPCQFAAACAPHIAAALEGRRIDRAALLAGAHRLAARADRLVVEGAGGFRVPLGPDFDGGDLAADLGLPIVLVVGLRLGCLNHALLSAEAVAARGLRLAGWIGNTPGPAMPQAGDNLAYLIEAMERLGAPCLGVVPRLDGGAAPADLLAWLDAPALQALFELTQRPSLETPDPRVSTLL